MTSYHNCHTTYHFKKGQINAIGRSGRFSSGSAEWENQIGGFQGKLLTEQFHLQIFYNRYMDQND